MDRPKWAVGQAAGTIAIHVPRVPTCPSLVPAPRKMRGENGDKYVREGFNRNHRCDQLEQEHEKRLHA